MVVEKCVWWGVCGGVCGGVGVEEWNVSTREGDVQM